MRKLFLVSLIVLLSFAILATSVNAEDYPRPRVVDEADFTLAYLLPETTNESSIRHYQQVQNDVEERGWNLISETNATYEPDQTREAFQRVMDQDPDAILFSYLEVSPIRDLIVEARERGIGVYNVGTDLVPGVLLSTANSNEVIAAEIMDYVVQRMGGSGDVVGFLNLWMPRGRRRDIIAKAIIEDGWYDYGETVHFEVTPEGYTDEIFSVTQDWITEFGNDLDFVWVCWDLGGITAAQAMAAQGYTDPDDMFTVGIDGGSHPWAIIRRGEIPFVASLAEPFELQVHKTIEAIHQIQVEEMMPGDPDSIAPATNILHTGGTKVIDKTNVPEPGDTIHEVFDYYGEDPDDEDAWYNWGEPFTVEDWD